MHHRIDSYFTENTNYSNEKIYNPIKTIYSNKSYLNNLKDQNNNIKLRNKNPSFKITYSNKIFKPKKTLIRLNKNNKLKQENYNEQFILKNLDIWDKDHINLNKDNPVTLYEYLKNYYEKNNFIDSEKKLKSMENMLKSKTNFNKLMTNGNKSNKILEDFFNKRNKDQGSILKNNIYKSANKYRFSILSKDIIDSFDIDSKTMNVITSDDINNGYYNKVIKDKIKYENQMREELININNEIINKKFEKKSLVNNLNDLYNEHNLIIKNYNDQINAQKKQILKFQQIYENQNKKILKNFLKETKNEKFYRNTKATKMNNEFYNKLKHLKTIHKNELENLLEKKTKNLENIKIIDKEIEYYKQVNDELIKEHKVYYMDILKKGYDSRKEGLVWVVKNLLEINTNLEYHHFPKFLTHEDIDYLINLAKIILEENQLNIILKCLKDKQKELNFKENFRRYSQIEIFLEKFGKKNNNGQKKIINLKYSNNELQFKNKIDKKFLKIYAKNDEMFKIFSGKNLEEEQIEQIISEIKENIIKKNISNKNKEKDLLEIFMKNEKQRNILNIIIYIKKKLIDLKEKKHTIITNKIQDIKERENDVKIKETVKSSMEKELIRKCLFGSFNINLD